MASIPIRSFALSGTYVVDVRVLVVLLAHAMDPLDADLGGFAVEVRDQHVVPRQVLVGVLWKS